MDVNGDNNELWRMVILDVSGLYVRIYDEIYGNNDKKLNMLLDTYDDRSTYKCILL